LKKETGGGGLTKWLTHEKNVKNKLPRKRSQDGTSRDLQRGEEEVETKNATKKKKRT